MHISAYNRIILFVATMLFSNVALAAFVELPKEAAIPELPYPLVGDYMSGGFALRHSDHEAAAKIFLSALQKDPNNQIILRNSYTTLLSVGKVNKSIDIAKKYLENDSADPSLSILLSTDDIKNKEFAKAEAALDNAARTAQMSIPSSVGMVITPFLKFWTMIGQGKFDEAHQYQEDILGKAREPSLFMYYQSALIYDIEGNYAKAEENYAHLIKDGTTTPYHYARAVGNFYERMAKTEKAKLIYENFQNQPTSLDHFKTNIENIDNGEAITKKVVPNAMYGFNEVLKEAVRILYASGFYEDGITYLRLSLFLNPDDEETNMLLASYYDQRSEFKNAISIYNKINKKSDFYITSRLAIADNLYNEGKKRHAVRQLIKISGGKQSNVALLTLADILRKDMKFDLAITVYNKIIKDIGKPEAKDWPIFFARGICNERSGNWDASERDLLLALQLKPNQPELLNYLGYSWIERNKNINEAKNMVAAAVQARPDDGQIIDSMGWALFKINDYDSASKFLERAAELMPYDAVVNDHLGDSYWKQGRLNEAKFQWNRVLKYNNSEEIIEKKIRAKLKNGLSDALEVPISVSSGG
jgi:tetratricopeptide (TPR) repeat protein